MHECPRCGTETDGAWSEGGLKWAICEECMQEERSLPDPRFASQATEDNGEG